MLRSRAVTMAFPCPQRPPLAWICLFLYAFLLCHSVWKASLPSITCSETNSCLRPLVQPGEQLSLELWTFQPSANSTRFQWSRVETCVLNVTLPSSGILPREVTSATENCTLMLPPMSRMRWSDPSQMKGGPLHAKFVFYIMKATPNPNKHPMAEVPFDLTRIVEPASMFSSSGETNTARRNLLNEPRVESDRKKESAISHKYVPYLKYGSQPIVIRFVADNRSYGGPPFVRNDGVALSRWNQTTYRPLLYVDENALQRSMEQEIAPPEDAQNKPPVSLRIQIGALSPIRDAVNQQLTMALGMAETMFPGCELDEFRYFLRDERLYRFFLTQVISFIHVWVDYLAFRDEVRFYRQKTNFGGISVSSVLTKLVCSIIIFLYLLDGGGTSWVVLISVLSGVVVDVWKAFKLLRPQLVSTFPFVKFRVVENPNEQTTAEYDRIAMTYLSFFLYPLVIGFAMYALKVSPATASCSMKAHFKLMHPYFNTPALCIQVMVFLAY